MKIRPFEAGDSQHFNLPPFPQGTKAWIVLDPYPVGYVAYSPIAGLPHLADLYGYIVPYYRRKGYASRMLSFMLDELANTSITQIAAPSEDINSSSAEFLRYHGFFVEHVEWDMVRYSLDDLSPPDLEIVELPLDEGVPLLRELYNFNFKDSAWYQPYGSNAELREELGPDGRCFFAYEDGQPIAFIGATIENNSADLEPVGVVQAHRNKGVGQRTLNALLNKLKADGLESVSLTVWSTNAIAVKVYTKAGFQIVNTRTYLAYNLDGAAPPDSD